MVIVAQIAQQVETTTIGWVQTTKCKVQLTTIRQALLTTITTTTIVTVINGS